MNPKKENILKAASKVFAENGFDRAKLDDIAKAADVGKGTLYQYFKNKEDLFISVFEENMEQLTQVLFKQTDEIEDPVERTIEGIRLYMDFFEKHPELIDLTAHERSSFKDKLQKNYFEHYMRYFEKGKDPYHQAVSEGQFRDYTQEDLMIAIVGTMNTFIYFWQRGGRTFSLKQKADIVIEMFFNGILTEKGKNAYHNLLKKGKQS